MRSGENVVLAVNYGAQLDKIITLQIETLGANCIIVLVFAITGERRGGVNTPLHVLAVSVYTVACGEALSEIFILDGSCTFQPLHHCKSTSSRVL